MSDADYEIPGPVGEFPDVPARSGVQAVLGAADKPSAAVQAVAEIRELHTHSPAKPRECAYRHPGWCTQCGVSWPCLTVAVLKKWGLS